jgi:aminoglycoside 3-N-acetyltransferase I
MQTVQITRLGVEQIIEAGKLFALMTEVFGESERPLRKEYVLALLQKDSFWAVAAMHGDLVIGGLTAHVLPLTAAEESELMIYDFAVHAEFQRKGVGRLLMDWVRDKASKAGLATVFVLADNADAHAIDFYKKTGAVDSPVTLFAWD